MTEAALQDLSDAALVARVASLCVEQCLGTAEIIRCLVEVEDRQIHLNAAYSSMYEYCTRRLKMSESTTTRRLGAARLVRRFPQLLPRIACGEVHLSSLVLLRDHLTVANADELLAVIAGKSKREIEELLVARRPKPDVPPSILPIVEDVAVPEPSSSTPAAPAARPAPSGSRIAPLSPSRFEVKLTVSLEVRAKFERAQNLMRHRNANGDLAVVIERALDALIVNLERVRLGKALRPRTTVVATKEGTVPRPARREVFARDGEQCTFRDASGNRCTEQGFLELDHVHASALGGSDEASNLRVLCKPHNRFHAEQDYGREHVANAIDRRRRKSRAAKAAKIESGTPRDESPPAIADAEVTSNTEVTTMKITTAAEVTAAPPFGIDSPPAAAEADCAPEVAVTAPEPARDVIAASPAFLGYARALQGLRNLGFKHREASLALQTVLRRQAMANLAIPLPDVLRETIGLLTSTIFPRARDVHHAVSIR